MEYQSTFFITPRDAARFIRRQLRRGYGKTVLFFGLLGAVSCWFTAGEDARSQPAYLALAMAMAFLMVALVSLLGHALIAHMRTRRTRGYEEDVKITATGVRVRAQGRERRVGFDKLLEIRETARDFYLYTDREHAWILPKAQMKDRAAECAQLRRIFDAIVESSRLHLQKK